MSGTGRDRRHQGIDGLGPPRASAPIAAGPLEHARPALVTGEILCYPAGDAGHGSAQPELKKGASNRAQKRCQPSPRSLSFRYFCPFFLLMIDFKMVFQDARQMKQMAMGMGMESLILRTLYNQNDIVMIGGRNEAENR
jgi:hypothetical protein